MRLAGRPELGHLTYCTNIHPGESWPEVQANLERYLPAVKRELASDCGSRRSPPRRCAHRQLWES